MRTRATYNRFSATMTGALLVFLGAAILSNAGNVTVFLVRLAGSVCAICAVVIFGRHLMKAPSIDLVPFEELLGAGGLLLLGAIVALYPALFAKVIFSVMGVLIAASGLGDIMHARTLVTEDDQVQRVMLRMGIVTVAVGLFVALVPSAAVRAIPVVCGVALVVDGLSELYLALTMPAE